MPDMRRVTRRGGESTDNICYRKIAMLSEMRAKSEGFVSLNLCMRSPPTAPDTYENKETKNARHETCYEERW